MSLKAYSSQGLSGRTFPKGTVAALDAYWANTKLLVHGDAANNSVNSTFIDSSPSARTVTLVGLVSQGSVSPYQIVSGASYSPDANIGSGQFIGNASNVLTTPDGTDFALSGDFTIEAWICPTQIVGGTSLMQTSNWSFYFDASGKLSFVFQSVVNYTSAANAMSANNWYHVAVSRASGTLRLFVNGVVAHSVANSTSPAVTAGQLTVGLLIGCMSDVHFIKGVGKYTAAFAPPTAPVSTVAESKLLLKFNKAAIRDEAAKNNIVLVGDARAMVSANKFGGSSLYFDGTGDYLTAVYAAGFAAGTSNFTVEGWYRASSFTGSQYGRGLFSLCESVASIANRLIIRTDATGKINAYLSISNSPVWGSGGTTSTLAMSTDTWYHIALVRSAGVFKVYVNGVAWLTMNTPTQTVNAMTYCDIGQSRDGTLPGWNGYIDDFRITPGIARYTADFTPVDAPFPNR